jgi:hypothetical protein
MRESFMVSLPQGTSLRLLALKYGELKMEKLLKVGMPMIA